MPVNMFSLHHFQINIEFKSVANHHILYFFIFYKVSGKSSFIKGHLPGVSLTVVLPGYNVFKKLSSCHPVRGREGRRVRRKRWRETGSQITEKLLAYTNKPQSHAWIKCQCVCVCARAQKILTGQRLGNESLPLKCCHGVSLQERGWEMRLTAAKWKKYIYIYKLFC